MKKKSVLLLAGIFAILLASAQEKRPDPQPAPETGEKFRVGMA